MEEQSSRGTIVQLRQLTESMKPWKRKVLSFVFIVIGLVVLTVVMLPIWFPWALRPALRHFGFRFVSYERLGYSRFAIVETTFTRDASQFRAARIEGFVPTVWLWHRQFRHTNELYLHLSDWQFDQAADQRAKPEKVPAQSASLFQVLDQVESKLSAVGGWLPRARLTRGKVRAGRSEFEIPEIEWHDGHLRTEATRPGLAQRLRLEGDFTRHSRWPIQIQVEPLNVQIAFELKRTGDFAEISGVLRWQTNRLTFASQFPRQGWLPTAASLISESFRVPAADLNLKGYSEVSGSLSVRWRQSELEAELQAKAKPIDNKTPEFTVNLLAHGNTNLLSLDRFQVATPFLQANLSPNTELSFSGELLSPESEFRFDVDLAQQPWVAVTGKLHGEVRLQPATRKYPDASFQMAGTGLRALGTEIQEFATSGSMRWPRLEVQSCSVRLPENTSVRASGSVNLQSRVISDGLLTVTGAGQLPLAPPGHAFDHLSARTEFQGRLDNLAHSFRLDVSKLRLAKLQPMNLSVVSSGQHGRFDRLDARLEANASSLNLGAAALIATNRFNLRLATLTLMRGEEGLFALAQPVELRGERLHPGGTHVLPQWTLHCGQFDWRASERALQLGASTRWPNQGTVSVGAHQIDAHLFQDFVTARLPELAVNDFALRAGWTNGPAQFQLALNSKLTRTNAAPFAAELNGSGTATGLMVDRLELSDGTNVILSGEGSLPLTINPGRTGAVVHVETRQPIEFRAETKPNPNFWTEISQWTPFTLQEPSIDLAVSGTLESPKGRINLNIASVRLSGDPNRKLPRFDKLTANMEIVPGRLRLHNLNVLIEDQPVRVAGDVPFGTDFSRPLKEVVQWQEASARVQIDQASLAPFAAHFPKVLSPQGHLTLDLTMRPGLNLDGALVMTNVATRPLMPIGAVQDVSARLQFAEQRVQLENFTGFLGGAPLVVSGSVDLAHQNPESELPQFDFKIRGDNIPLARQPELILRSDLDLRISNLTNSVPVVGGTVRLRDSFFLADLKLLIPGRVAAPRRRPPYFSIEADPLSGWRLAVRVLGDRFLNVRTPFFRGAISTDVNVQGTLLEPAAIGTARINDGVIQFPFANLRVDQGLVFLASDNPYRPRLQVFASARAFGYEIKMEVSGSADEPIVQFSSTPALSSEQIVLLLTTGEMPGHSITFSTQQRAGRMALFVGKSLLSKLTGGEGNSDRLTIRSGESLATDGKQTYYIEYKLAEDWSLIGEYDRFSAFNAGVKWRFYSK